TVTLILGIVIVMAGYAWVQISNEVVLHEADLQRARRNGRAWVAVIDSVWGREGEARARELIDLSVRRADRPNGTLRIISLAPGAPDAPRLSRGERRALADGEIVRRIDPDEGNERLFAYAAIRSAA